MDSADAPALLPQSADTLAEAHALAFTLTLEGVSRQAFVVRAGGVLHAYVDSCRHQSRTLDLGTGPVLQEGLIPCRHHGAMYRVEDGVCVSGPCAGAALTELALEQRDGRWWCVGRAKTQR
jgi:nitrite reductase/ring-hydroxylating ferredoxin subunit